MPLKKRKSIAVVLRRLGACPPAVEWSKPYKDDYEKAWRECERGDYLLWLLGILSGQAESEGRKKLLLCACDCATLTLKFTKDHRFKKCIDTARKWAKGKVSTDELIEARYRTGCYPSSAYAAVAYALEGSDAAYAAGAAAVVAVHAAVAAADDADDAEAAKEKTSAKCATIVRKHYPEPPEV
jgi:hypothetical protein